MKLSCGPTADERAEEYVKQRRAQEKYLTNWHTIFAFTPKRMWVQNKKEFSWESESWRETHECRWLELVERKYRYVKSDLYGRMIYGDPIYRPVNGNSGTPAEPAYA